MDTEYFFVSLTPGQRGGDFWFSRVFPITYKDNNDLSDQQGALAALFAAAYPVPKSYNAEWSKGYETFERACAERASDIVKPGTPVHTPVWPADAADCPKPPKRK